MKPLVYIAGPISSNPMHGTHTALRCASRMMEDDIAVPLVPHLTVFWDIVFPHQYEDWMRLDFNMIERCDAVFRLQGESPGADRELEHAIEEFIPVFGSEHNAWEGYYPGFSAWCGFWKPREVIEYRR